MVHISRHSVHLLYAFFLSVQAFYVGPRTYSIYQRKKVTTYLRETKKESIMEGVKYENFVREWRCKWSPDGGNASLLACQMALEAVFDDLNEIGGLQGVQRMVCEENFEFKVRSHFA